MSLAIYSLDTPAFGGHSIQYWGDLYARRYGNPDERIRVIHADGSEDFIDYKFMRNTLIPNLIENILGISHDRLHYKLITKTDIEQMSTKILDSVKRLNLYSIQYKTLLNLAYDLAIQPPHPWFVNEQYLCRTVEYDLARAEDHHNRMHSHLQSSDPASCRNSCYENIHHACSAMLAHYGMFMGTKFLRPLHVLIYVLNMRNDEGNIVLWHFCRIQQIEGDLRALGVSIKDLSRILAKTSKLINGASENTETHLVNNASKIYNTAKLLINSKDNMRANIALLKENPSLVSDGIFFETIRNILKAVPGFEVPDAHDKTFFWLINKRNDSIFRDIKSKILIWPIFQHGTIRCNSIETPVAECNNIISRTMLSNTAIFIALENYSGQCSTYIKDVNSKESSFFLFNTVDIISIYEARDRATKFQSLLFRYQ